MPYGPTSNQMTLSRLAILYFNIHKISHELTDNTTETLNIAHFDSSREVMDKLYHYLSTHPELLPKNIVCLFSQGKHVKGMGTFDPLYDAKSRLLDTMSHNLGLSVYSESIFHHQIPTITHLLSSKTQEQLLPSYIAIIHNEIHAYCRAQKESFEYNFLQDIEVDLSDKIDASMQKSIYKFYQKNYRMIPLGYSLKFSDHGKVKGWGPQDEDYLNTAMEICPLGNMEEHPQPLIVAANPISAPKLGKLETFIKQCAEGQIPGINLESREYSLLTTLGTSLESRLADFKSGMLKTCQAYHSNTLLFIKDCHHLLRIKYAALDLSNQGFFYFHHQPSDLTCAQKTIKAIRNQLRELEASLKPESNVLPAPKVAVANEGEPAREISRLS